ncbi:hypothetical protein HGRIS_007056 [Hohenbuehelia grisea]|uniref:Uncharacterized protein n=1 Tax=Hohenbuehelia grisea TaxID=104357 RepID=A0ABR3JAV9_9AGAR
MPATTTLTPMTIAPLTSTSTLRPRLNAKSPNPLVAGVLAGATLADTKATGDASGTNLTVLQSKLTTRPAAVLVLDRRLEFNWPLSAVAAGDGGLYNC